MAHRLAAGRAWVTASIPSCSQDNRQPTVWTVTLAMALRTAGRLHEEPQLGKSPTGEVMEGRKAPLGKKPSESMKEEKVALGIKPLCMKLHPSTSTALDFKTKSHHIAQTVLD